MGIATSPRFALREATAADHERVDAAFADFDLADRDSYAAFLVAQAGALLPTETGLDRADAARVLPDWSERRRSALLREDLAELGLEAEGDADPVSIEGVEGVLGAAYVLEGSRMGGRMLARQVAPDLPRRFLDSPDNGRWRDLTQVLDATLRSERQLAVAIEAARAVFARFEASARHQAQAGRR